MSNIHLSDEHFNAPHFRRVESGLVKPHYQWFDVSTFSWRPTTLREEDAIEILPDSPAYREPVTREAIACAGLQAVVEKLKSEHATGWVKLGVASNGTVTARPVSFIRGWFGGTKVSWLVELDTSGIEKLAFKKLG